MAAPKYIWPVHFFTAEKQKWVLRGAAKSGGTSISGNNQAARTEGGGYWACEYANISLRTADQIRAWRAWEVILDGGATPCIMQICDPKQRPQVLIGGLLIKGHTVPHVDGDLTETSFSDDTDYESVPIVASVSTAAALRATTLQIAVSTGVELRGGEHFSIDHAGKSHRMYRVRTVEALAGGVYTITFRPPLREATPAGRPVEFNYPQCVMRLADPEQMAVPIEAFVRATADVTFLEHFE